ncbi:MAG: ThuA domain-containing protein [Gemmataceae bacterium]
MLPLLLALTFAADDKPFLTFDGGDGPGKGKHVVLVSGDDEYRSEEAMPQLARILSTHHGFKTTVLFAIDPATGTVKPDHQTNIPGLEALKTADLCVLFLRFRNLPDDQMKHLDDYLAAGKPVIGLRTSTHPFNVPKGKTYSKWSHNSGVKGWEQGFGKQVFGETWYTHHGGHGSQSTRGVVVEKEKEKDHPILRGIKDGDIWGPTDVYGVRPLPGDSKPLVLGQVLNGMKPADPPVEGKKNDPMMPIAWTKSFSPADGVTCQTFCCTCCSSQDLESAGLRRLLVNATYALLGMEGKVTAGLKVDLVGKYEPSPFGFGKYQKGLKPADFAK